MPKEEDKQYKTEVDYREWSPSTLIWCQLCKFFVSYEELGWQGGTCQQVMGVIDRRGTCREFVKKT
jgi:hypothetical protein